MQRNAFVRALITAGILASSAALAQPTTGAAGTSSQTSQVNTQAASTQSQAGNGQLSRSDVSEIQKALNQKGFMSGSVDGVMGPQTRSAIRNFQTAEGLNPTGQLDQSTILALGFSAANFAGGRFQTTSPQQAKLTPTDIQQVQQALNDQGYSAGRVDGRWGTQSKDAMIKFQRAKGIQPTGQIDQESLLALGIPLSEFAAGEFAKQPMNQGPANGRQGTSPGQPSAQ